MKPLFRIIANVMLMISLSFGAFGQVSENSAEHQKFEDQFISDINGLSNFTYKVVEKKVYFNFTVKNLKEDCVFVIERSLGNDNFKNIAFKMGRANDKNVNILYCFQDSLNFEQDKAIYRLKQVFETSGTFYSNSYTIENNQYVNLMTVAE